jgi:hypothetical protein
MLDWMSRVAAALVITLVTSSAVTSFGSEFAVSAPTPAEAAFAQVNPSVASNGSESFAIWFDRRSTTFDTMGVLWTLSPLYGARVNASGQFVDSFGRKIADDITDAHIASNGDGYLLVDSTFTDGTFAVRIENDGTISEERTPVSDGRIMGLVSNGRDFLALILDNAGQKFTGKILDSHGASHRSFDLGNLHAPELVVAGSSYRIIDQQWTCDGVHPCDVAIRLTSISSDASAATSRIVGPATVPQSTVLNAIATKDRIVIAFTSEVAVQQTKAERVATIFSTDFDGNDVSMPRQIVSGPTQCFCASWQTLLAWDGSSVLVAWPDPIGDLPPYNTRKNFMGIRAMSDGTQIDPVPFRITTAFGARFSWAASRNGVLFVSSEERRSAQGVYYGSNDLYARQVRTFADLAEGGAGESVVQTASAQFDAAVASSGSSAIVAWRDFEQPSAIATAIIDVSHPSPSASVRLSERNDVAKLGISAAILGDAALVAWREETDRSVRVLARRIGLSGVPLDAQEIEIANSPTISPWPGNTSIATDGSQFFLVWAVDDHVFGVRLRPDGTIVDKEPIVVSRDEPYEFRHVHPRVVWTGTVFLAIWADDPNCYCLTPPLPANTIVRSARVTSSGAVLDAVKSATLINQPGGVAEVAIARNGDTIMAVWSAGSDDDSAGYGWDLCKHALPLDPNGNPRASKPVQFGCEDLHGHPSWLDDVKVVPGENGFLAMWSSNATQNIAGMILTLDGTPAGSFAVPSPGRPAWSPDATSTPFGALIVYDHIANEPQYGGVARLFGNVLDVRGPEKRRAVRR